MKASPDFCMRLLTRLRGRVALRPEMKGVDMDAQLADYASELTAFGPHEVEAGVLGWSRKPKAGEWWPTLSQLLQSIGEARETHQARIAGPRSASDGLQEALERCMAELPSTMLLRLHALHDTNPDGRRRIITRLARWAQGYPDHTRAEAMAFLMRELPPVEVPPMPVAAE